MTDMKPNADLAYRALDLINQHREHFDMRTWADRNGFFSSIVVTLDDLTGMENECGTVACFAGWVVALEGYGIDTYGNAVRGVEKERVADVAANLLRIECDNVDNLFFRTATSVIAEAVADIFGPRPEVKA